MDKKHCPGCEQNFYNGNNPYGIKECWHLADAKRILRKEVGINDMPPWNHKPQLLPSCFHRSGYIYVKPDVTD